MTRSVNWNLLSLTRFFLAFVVLNHHMDLFTASKFCSTIDLFGGKAAVIGFLMISGFSVANSLDKQSYKFLLRRLIRIYPAYLFSILFVLVLQYVVPNYSWRNLNIEADSLYTVIGNIFLLQMYVCKALSYNPLLWSLSIEFSFYTLLAVISVRYYRVLPVLFLISLVYFSLPAQLSSSPYYVLFMKLNMVRYLWPFIIGVWLSRSGMSKPVMAMAILGIPAICMSDATPESLSTFTYIITFTAILLALRTISKNNPVINFVGDVSYPLYLLHFPIAIMIVSIGEFQSSLAITIISLAAAAGTVLLIERPIHQTLTRSNRVRDATWVKSG